MCNWLGLDGTNLQHWLGCPPRAGGPSYVGDSKVIICFIAVSSFCILAGFHVVDRHRLGHVFVRALVETLLDRINLLLNLVLEFLLDLPVDPVLLVLEILESGVLAGVVGHQIRLAAHLNEAAVELLLG